VEEEEVEVNVDSTTTTSTSGEPSPPPTNKRPQQQQQRWGQGDGDIEMDKLSRTSSLDVVDQDEEDAGTFILELDKESGLGDSDRTYRTRIERGWAFALSKVGPLVGALGALAALGFIFAVWGGIPLGDPKEDLFDEDGSWPLIFITNPLVRTSAPPPRPPPPFPIPMGLSLPSHGTVAALLLLVPHHHEDETAAGEKTIRT
jgi:hypothetical protein